MDLETQIIELNETISFLSFAYATAESLPQAEDIESELEECFRELAFLEEKQNILSFG